MSDETTKQRYVVVGCPGRLVIRDNLSRAYNGVIRYQTTNVTDEDMRRVCERLNREEDEREKEKG